MNRLVENQDVDRASDWVVVRDGTRDDGKGERAKARLKTRNVNSASSIMDEQATTAQHSVVGVCVEVCKRLGTMWGFRVQLCNYILYSSHSGYAITTND
jgi:hypothetical protein